MVGRKKKKFDFGKAVIVAVLTLLTFATAWPILYIVSISLSGSEHVLLQDIYFFPKDITIESYKLLGNYGDLWSAYSNTILYTFAGTAIGVVGTIMLSFAVAQKNFYHRGIVIWLVTITMFFSGGMIANYIVISKLGLLNTIWSVILPGSVNAWNMMIAKTYFSGLSESVMESAELDGCGPIRKLIFFAVPLAKPIIAVLTLYMVVGFWNTYFTSMLYLEDSKQLIQNYLQRLFNSSDFGGTGTGVDATIEAAQIKYTAIVVTMFPIMAIYPFLQKYFVHGIMVGAVKE